MGWLDREPLLQAKAAEAMKVVDDLDCMECLVVLADAMVRTYAVHHCKDDHLALGEIKSDICMVVMERVSDIDADLTECD